MPTPPNLRTRSVVTINPWAVAALLLSLWAWAALLSPFYFTGAHDGRHSLFYQLQFIQGVADGQAFPRWGPDFGFGRGYPFFIFYAPLSSYVVQAVYGWGIGGLVASVKASWALGFLVGAAGTFRLAKSWWRDDRAAFIAALLFTFVPYKLVDIFVRAALAEFWSLALFPWLLLAFGRVVRQPRPRPVAVAALLYAALLLTHVATTLLFSFLLGAYLLFEWALQRWKGGHATGRPSVLHVPVAVAAALALGVLNGTLFWLPLLAEQRYIDVTQYVPENYNFANQFTEWSQFLSPVWGFGFAVPGPNDGMSFQLGVVPLLLALVVPWLLGQGRLGREAAARLVWTLLSLVVVVVAMTSATHALWQSFPLAAMVQFPWRLLGLATLLLALLGGGAMGGLLRHVPHDAGRHPAVALIALLIVAASLRYTTPQFTPPSDREETLLTILDFQREYRDMAGRLARSEVVPQDSPMEAQYEALEPPQKFALRAGEATIEQSYYGGSTVRARMVAAAPSRVELMTYDYPGWTIYLDGQRHPHALLPPDGTIVFDLPPGEHVVEARFEDTPLRRAATWLSLFGLGITIGLIIVTRDM